MRFYKVSFVTVKDNSHGFAFFTAQRDADAALARFKRENEGAESSEVEAVDVIPTKQGILYALNHHGCHPDNG